MKRKKINYKWISNTEWKIHDDREEQRCKEIWLKKKKLGEWDFKARTCKNLNHQHRCRDRTEKERETWKTSPCSHSSSSFRTWSAVGELWVSSVKCTCTASHPSTTKPLRVTNTSQSICESKGYSCDNDSFQSLRADNKEVIGILRAFLWKYQVQYNTKL